MEPLTQSLRSSDVRKTFKHLLLHFEPDDGDAIVGCASGRTGSSPPGSSRLTLTLSPADTTAWSAWRPVYNTTAAFVATLSGTDATQSLSDVTYTFTLSEVSSWPGYCMNMAEETASEETASDKDLEFREADQPKGNGATYGVSNRGQTLTVTFASKPDASETTTSETDEATSHEVRFTVRVLDYAAVGKLQATVNKSTQGAPTTLWIPRAPAAAAHLERDFRDVASKTGETLKPTAMIRRHMKC